MTLSAIINAILSPNWLVTEIPLIALLMGGSILLYFGNFAHHKVFFPIADFVRSKTHQRINATTKYDTSTIAKYGSEAIATAMFLLYVYFGAYILAEYVFEPMLLRLQNVIMLLVIFLFLILSFAINNLKIRKRFMGK